MTTHVVLDPQARIWASGRVIAGGSPWRLSALRGRLAVLADRISRSQGPLALTDEEARVARVLIRRGLAHALPRAAKSFTEGDVCVVIPVRNDPNGVESALASIPPVPVVVVDDASDDPQSLAQVVDKVRMRTGATITLVRLPKNVGPGIARNRGVELCTHPLVAFLDADCVAEPGWLSAHLHHFDDPSIAAVAPRVLPDMRKPCWEAAAGALDMGTLETYVRPGARVSFVPSAALLARRHVLRDIPFNAMRVGEDVDLVWRLQDAGLQVRYDPRALVRHRVRPTTWAWLVRMHTYGTSAAPLANSHPGRLNAADVSAWNMLAITAAVAGFPRVAAAILLGGGASLGHTLRTRTRLTSATGYLIRASLVSDTRSLGSALRREWWPVGLAALACSPRFPVARRLSVLMIAPLILDYGSRPRAVSPVRYVAARFAADVAYGTGVTRSVLTNWCWTPLSIRLRRPSVANDRKRL